MYQIREMTQPFADDIANWKYSGAYALYSFRNDEGTMAELMSGQYFSCVSGEGKLTGYFCFGEAARIPAQENDIYDDGFLDIGLGMRPELCGRGLGEDFMHTGMDFAAKNFHARRLRLCVAAFNKRAISLYEKVGFRTRRKITHRISAADFYMMVFMESSGDVQRL